MSATSPAGGRIFLEDKAGAVPRVCRVYGPSPPLHSLPEIISGLAQHPSPAPAGQSRTSECWKPAGTHTWTDIYMTSACLTLTTAPPCPPLATAGTTTDRLTSEP